MRALVVYESMFGNTRDVAEAIATGLVAQVETTVSECSTAPGVVPADVDLLVVGAPTHALGLSRPSTRASAQKQADSPLVSQGQGLREWLSTLRFEGDLPAVAAFDTRVRAPRLLGSAAPKALRRLRRSGGRPLAKARSFLVTGTTGPLAAGELAAAKSWGSELAAAVSGWMPKEVDGTAREAGKR
jgi:hypothetical protein